MNFSFVSIAFTGMEKYQNLFYFKEIHVTLIIKNYEKTQTQFYLWIYFSENAKYKEQSKYTELSEVSFI